MFVSVKKNSHEYSDFLLYEAASIKQIRLAIGGKQALYLFS